jgi:putative pyruvate formate lyase activating enzyme
MTLLERFQRRARGEELAGFARAKAVRLPVSLEAPSGELRAAHEEGMKRLAAGDAGGDGVTLLDVKRALARRLLAPCRLCALECNVDRTKGPAGVCGLGSGAARYLDFVHEGEEPEISPTHAIFLSGCSYRCAYCSDWDHVAPPLRDPAATSAELARSIERRRAQGVASLSWIGGEPIVNLPAILDALALAETSVPVVLNSNLHAGPETLELLEGVVDAYVADLKHGNDACAREVARAPRYLEVVVAAIERAARDAFTIVRHLVLPGHVACCTIPVLERLRGLPVRVNLMEQYRPNENVRGSALDRRPSGEELAVAREAARRIGLPLAPLAATGPKVLTGEDPVAFASGIWIDADGKVTFENLSPELGAIVEELGGPDA